MSMIFVKYPTLLKRKKEPNERERTTSLVSEVSDAAFQGWKLYMTHPTRNAGLCLAFLYMTVLGFSNVLWAYSLLQCVKEHLLSLLLGAAAIIGILGTMAFPCLRNCAGVECAGQVGLLALLTASGACVLSVFLVGSPWDIRDQLVHLDGVITFGTSLGTGMGAWLESAAPQTEGEDPQICPIKVSIYVLLAGVVAARWGLWLTDIAITQIQQQEVAGAIRGKIGGVQGALNSVFELLMYALVITFPQANQFGYLVFASYFSLCCGTLLYTTYSRCGCRNSAHFADIHGGTKQTQCSSSKTPLLIAFGNSSSKSRILSTSINANSVIT